MRAVGIARKWGHVLRGITVFKISMNFHDYSKNKNHKIYISFDSAHCASFIKTGVKLRGGEVCTSLVEKPPSPIDIEGKHAGRNMQETTFHDYL